MTAPRCLAALALLMLSVSAHAATYCADPSESGNTKSGTYPGNCKRDVQNAQDAAGVNDTICLMPGQNQTRVVMDTNGQTLTRCAGVANDAVSLGPQTTQGDGSVDIYVTADDVTIDGISPGIYFFGQQVGGSSKGKGSWLESSATSDRGTVQNVTYDSGSYGRQLYDDIFIFGKSGPGAKESCDYDRIPDANGYFDCSTDTLRLIRIEGKDWVIQNNSLVGAPGQTIAVADSNQRTLIRWNFIDQAYSHLISVDSECNGSVSYMRGLVVWQNVLGRSYSSDAMQTNADSSNTNPYDPHPAIRWPCQRGTQFRENYSYGHGENSVDMKSGSINYVIDNFIAQVGSEGTDGLAGTPHGSNDYDGGCASSTGGLGNTLMLFRGNAVWGTGQAVDTGTTGASVYGNTIGRNDFANDVGGNNPNCEDAMIGTNYDGAGVVANNVIGHYGMQTDIGSGSSYWKCYAGNRYTNDSRATWRYAPDQTSETVYSSLSAFRSKLQDVGIACPETNSVEAAPSTLFKSSAAYTLYPPYDGVVDPFQNSTPDVVQTWRDQMELEPGLESAGEDFVFLKNNESNSSTIEVEKSAIMSICCVGDAADWPADWDGHDYIRVNGDTCRVEEIYDSTGTADGMYEPDTIDLGSCQISGSAGDPITVIDYKQDVVSAQVGSYTFWDAETAPVDPVDPIDSDFFASVTIASDGDDAEEDEADGSVSAASSYLDIARNLSTLEDQQVGLRFASVPVPPGAVIVYADVEFVATSDTSGTVTIEVDAEAADNAAAIAETTSDISGRTFGTAADWTPGSWSQEGVHHTADIAAQVQAVINRAGWATGNAILIRLKNETLGAASRRVAYSHNNDPSKAPRLRVYYNADNAAPELAAIGPKTAAEGKQMSFVAVATDPDGDPILSADLTDIPNYATLAAFDAATGAFTYTPGTGDATGSPYSVTITATDAADPTLTASEVVVITVTAAPPANATPVLAAIGNREAYEGLPLVVTITATDDTGSPILSIEQMSLPVANQGAFVDNGNGTAVWTWTPAEGTIELSPYSVTVTATDIQDGTLTDAETISVSVAQNEGLTHEVTGLAIGLGAP